MAGAVHRWEFPKGKTLVTFPLTLQMRPRGFSTGIGISASYVLTRLHTRYDRQALSADLVFRKADPVTGGRANWDGTLGDQGAQTQPSGTNNFQGRYIIRHYWEGKVTCKNPRYGSWGGPPSGSGLGRAGHAQAGVDLANAARGKSKLNEVVQSAIPSLGIQGQPPPRRP